jgi:hypothetical protein
MEQESFDTERLEGCLRQALLLGLREEKLLDDAQLKEVQKKLTKGTGSPCEGWPEWQ